MPHRRVIGSRLRQLREVRGWSQTQMAQTIPLSQKQLSRIEQGEIATVERSTLVRLGTVLEEPIRTGEINRWLYAFGYLPLVVPLLPLPDDYPHLVAQYHPYPATLLDIGWHLRHWNLAMERFYQIPNPALTGIERNWIYQYFHPKGALQGSYPEASRRRVLARLFWEWAPYYQEPWNQQLIAELETSLNLSWASLRDQYDLGESPEPPTGSDTVWLHGPQKDPLSFRTAQAKVPHRPDLRITVYEPLNEEAESWCLSHQGDDR